MNFLAFLTLLFALSFATTPSSETIHWLPHGCSASSSGGSHHGGGKVSMYELINFTPSQNAKVSYIFSTLEKKSIELAPNTATLPKSGVNNYHALIAEVSEDNRVYSAIYYIYKHGKPSQTSPTKLTSLQKVEFEIKPNPLPREHDRYSGSKEYSFLVTLDSKPQEIEVEFQTLNGTKKIYKSDANGVLKLTLPNDFKNVKHIRRANKASHFILSTKTTKNNKEYFTTLSAPYSVNPTNYWQSVSLGLITAIAGFIIGIFIYRKRKNG
ncbi:MAG: hypothetical protein GQ570_13510 [Helicobacteraceae bacterium]|nr:hypothetical protein [Helicobacteraceae bacterium]